MSHFAVSLTVIVLIICNANAQNTSENTSCGITNKAGTSKSCDNELEEIKKKMEDLMTENFIIRQELDLLTKRFDTELDFRKQEIPSIYIPSTTTNTVATTTTTTTRAPVTTTTKSSKISNSDTNPVAISTQSSVAAPTSCAEAMQSNADHINSGVYMLYLPDLPPFEVFCMKDNKNGSAWTIVQKRQDGSINFYRDWADYKNGFGNLYGEFWLGLEKLHALTNFTEQELWISLEDFEGEVREAKYDQFAIDNEKSKYRMKTLGDYTGDAGDSLRYHLNSKFSTRDSDNDNESLGGCAIVYTGAWWFNKCSNGDLNAKYLYKNDPEIEQGRGIEWFTWRGRYSLKRVHMAIRPITNA